MKSFLQQIAEYYVSRLEREITDCCFVFSNKRAGVFFNYFLARAAENAGFPLIHPEVMTISDFVSEFTDGVEASRIEQLFILYRCYKDIMKRDNSSGADVDIIDFNKFQFWGDVLLSDFTDVDKYLVDPSELFRNIEELKEISSNYLTDEQIEVIKRYWGEDKVPHQVAEFWNHVVHVSDSDHGDRKSTAGFVRLWQVMYQLYDLFNKELTARGLTSQGQMYRSALHLIETTAVDEFPYDRYVFIGFNVLSTVEERMFSALRDKGLAEFFWDYASPAFEIKENPATRFLQHYVEKFPQPSGAARIGREVAAWPRIEIIGVPSVNGQTKLMADVIKSLLPDGGSDNTLLSTAIVLPDENMCMPVINTLPDNIKEINVTMGFQLRNTPVASLLSSIVTMQLRSRKVRFEDTFFREDVIAVLSHPLVRSISSVTCDNIAKVINVRRLFNVPRELLLSPEYEPLHQLFAMSANPYSSRDVFSFLRELVNWLLEKVCKKYSIIPEDDLEEDNVDEDDSPEINLSASGAIEAGFLKNYLHALDELQRLQRVHLDDIKVDMTDSTVSHLVERLIAGESVTFEGRPLRGLQVMGMLETRALDFDNVIILSMNERIFPRKHFSKSFIPPALRYGYGMATIEHQECISAYYFYRLITRARRVFLLYDSRTQGTNSGEPSRYINQLRYLYHPEELSVKHASYNLRVDDTDALTLSLDGVRWAKLKRYVDPDNPQYISATSINNYINCPIQFALSYLEGYFDNDDVKDFFDEATFGSVLHQVVERLYSSLQVDGQPVLIERSVINKLNRTEVIMPEIHKAINTLYLGRSENDMSPLTGDANLIANMMKEMVQFMLSHELDNYDSFKFISGERKEEVRLRISDRLTINFRYTIDRVDEVIGPDGRRIIRIIDYKTGDDNVSTTISHMFEHYYGGRDKAVLQLFLYCNAFVQKNEDLLDDDTFVQPLIYRFRTIGQNRPPRPVSIDNEDVIDFRMFNDEVLERLDAILYPLFYPAHGDNFILQCPDDDHACKYCKFTPICMK